MGHVRAGCGLEEEGRIAEVTTLINRCVSALLCVLT